MFIYGVFYDLQLESVPKNELDRRKKVKQKARILCCIPFKFSLPVVIVSLIFSQDSDLFLQLLDLKNRLFKRWSEYIWLHGDSFWSTSGQQ